MDSIKITLNDLFRASREIEDKDSKIYNRVSLLLEKQFGREEEDFEYIEIFSDDVLFRYFMQKQKIVTLNDLSYAMSRAMYEKNKVMYKRLKDYYFELINIYRQNLSIEEFVIKTNIDKEALDYIYKYEDIESYVRELKPIKNMNGNPELIKGKAIIE